MCPELIQCYQNLSDFSARKECYVTNTILSPIPKTSQMASLILGQEGLITLMNWYRTRDGLVPWLNSGTVTVPGIREKVLYKLKLVHSFEVHKKYN
jgi:hypothetical protein